MTKRFAMLMATTALVPATSVCAQQEPAPRSAMPPPEHFAISKGGVDMRTGVYAYDVNDLSIGAGGETGSLKLSRLMPTPLPGAINPFANLSHNWDIRLTEKRVDMTRAIYSNGSGLDYRIGVQFGGRSETFDGQNNQTSFELTSKAGLARLTYSGTRSSEGVIYTFAASDGTKVQFRALGNGDCSSAARCAYPANIVHPDGTRIDFEYENPTPGIPNTTRLQSVVSSRGYAILFEYAGSGASWKHVTKACTLNLALVAKPPNNVCPAGAAATATYGYLSFESKQKLATATDSVGHTSSFTYTRSGSSVLVGFKKPGQSSAWLTNATSELPYTDATTIEAVNAQSFVGGQAYSYSYYQSPPVENEVTQIAGGTYTDALGGVTQVVYDFPLQPGPSPQSPQEFYTFQSTPGPVFVSDPAGRSYTTDYCDPTAMAGYPPEYDNRCSVLPSNSVVDSDGYRTDYFIPWYTRNLEKITTFAKAGSGLANIVVQSGFDNCANPVTCAKPLTKTDGRGNITNYTYDATHGGVMTETLPAAPNGIRPQKRYTYGQFHAWYKNAAGVLTQAAAPVWLVTAISECRTQSSCAGTADETKTTYSYGAAATANNLLPTVETASAGNGSLVSTVTRTFDAAGNIQTMDGPLSGAADTTRYRYDAANRLIGEVSPDPDGAGPRKHRATRNSYDPQGNLARAERGTVNGQSDGDWAGFAVAEQTDTLFDALGRRTRVSLSSGGTVYAVTDHSYRVTGELECEAVRMDPAQWASQSNACAPQTAGPNGPDRVTRYSYDAGGYLTKVQKAVGTADQADEETYSYTPGGRLATVKDGENNLTSYEYDGLGRLTKTRYPVTTLGGNASSATDYEQLSYDANGNVTQRRQRDGQLIGYSYDNLNRKTLEDLSGVGLDQDITFTYDLLGRPLHMQNAWGHIASFAYDALGRIITETTTYGPAKTSLYDAAGRRTRLTWHDGFYVSYDYDVTGNMTAIRENGAASGIGVLATYAYDNLGRRTTLTRGNGTVTSWSYDPVSRLASLGHDLASTTYDVSTSFAWNPASQIASSTRSNDLYAWGGHYNRNMAETPNGLNQLVTQGSTPLSYDGRGNVTNIGPANYSYTQRNNLVGFATGALYYDPLDRIDLIHVPAGTSTMLDYDGANLVTAYNYPSATMARRYVHGPGSDEPLVWYEGSGTTTRYFLYADERGTITAITDSAGVLQTVNKYDEYGNPQVFSGRFGYTGQTWLPELGMWNYKARIYNPKIGRFMQTDPIGYADGVNWYNYVGGDPVNLFDSDGESRARIPATQPRVNSNGNPLTNAIARNYIRQISTRDLSFREHPRLTNVGGNYYSAAEANFYAGAFYARAQSGFFGSNPAGSTIPALSYSRVLSSAQARSPSSNSGNPTYQFIGSGSATSALQSVVGNNYVPRGNALVAQNVNFGNGITATLNVHPGGSESRAGTVFEATFSSNRSGSRIPDVWRVKIEYPEK